MDYDYTTWTGEALGLLLKLQLEVMSWKPLFRENYTGEC